MLQHMWYYLRSQKGQSMVEYGLIIALVGIALIGALGVMEGGIENLFNAVKDKMPVAPG